MSGVFASIAEDIASQPFAPDVESFIVFGSNIWNQVMGATPGDTDICIVVNNRDTDLERITDFLFSRFTNPDYRIYFKDEVESDLQFMDKGVGVLALEYFSLGTVLYGENIFIEKLKRVNRAQLKESYLNKIFEYIVRIREAHFSKRNSIEYKHWHINKYIVRLLIDLLLYYDYISYPSLQHLTKQDIIERAKQAGILSQNTVVDFEDTHKLYAVFEEINKWVVAAHTS